MQPSLPWCTPDPGTTKADSISHQSDSRDVASAFTATHPPSLLELAALPALWRLDTELTVASHGPPKPLLLLALVCRLVAAAVPT